MHSVGMQYTSTAVPMADKGLDGYTFTYENILSSGMSTMTLYGWILVMWSPSECGISADHDVTEATHSR
jgi:hypothetical protein